MGNGMKPRYNQLITQLVKATVLASTAIISTWIIILCGMFVIPDIGWFVPVDGMPLIMPAFCQYVPFH